MAYWTLSNLFNLLPRERVEQLVCDDEDQIIQTPPSAAYTKISTAGGQADVEIESYLNGHYTTPLNPVPQIITQLSTIITVYNLYMRADSTTVPEKVRTMYQDAIAKLRQIAAGTVQLTTDISPRSRVAINKTNDDRIFSREVMETYV